MQIREKNAYLDDLSYVVQMTGDVQLGIQNDRQFMLNICIIVDIYSNQEELYLENVRKIKLNRQL